MRILTALINIIIFAASNCWSIKVNQIGYYPFARKTAVIADSSTAAFSVINAESHEVVYNGKMKPSGFDKTAEEYVSVAEFTSFTKEGIYRIVCDGKDTSCQFSISSSCYNDALFATLKSYYYLRCGIPLLSKFAGKWNRDSGHLADSILPVFDLPIDSVYDVRGGWYDAGDFGKYVVNAGITCGTLMALYELHPEIIGDSLLNIPESGNGKSDLLDEIKYELDWLIRMQDSDGGVFFKVGPVEWYGTIMPGEDISERYIIGKSTTSTLDFAAVMAMAGRVYKKYDSTFAQNCVKRSEDAWLWAVSNPSVAYPENHSGTGPYEDGGDITYKDEFLWALSELGITTRKTGYLDTLEKLILSENVSSPAWWQDLKNLAFFSLSLHSVLSDSANRYVKNKIISYADKVVSTIAKSPYLNPLGKSNYSWGSNGTCGNFGVVEAYAHYLTGDQKYLDALVLISDYLFGRNPTGYSYVTGLGSVTPVDLHHRQSKADGIDKPVPGFVVGGANCIFDGADEYLQGVIESETPPAKCYLDLFDSWASNENAINQNAPWVLVLAYLEKNASDNRAVYLQGNKLHNAVNSVNLKVLHEKRGIRILLNPGNQLKEISLITLQGKLIMKKNVNKGESSIFLSTEEVSSGSLIIQYKDNGVDNYMKIYCIK